MSLFVHPAVRKAQRERGWSDATILAIVLERVLGHTATLEDLLGWIREVADAEDEMKSRTTVKRERKVVIPIGTLSDMDAFGPDDVPAPRRTR